MEYICCWTLSKGWSQPDGETVPTLKVAVVGDKGCGKTSLIYRFSRGQMPPEGETPGLETDVMEVKQRGRKLNLVVYDTAGDEDYAKVRALPYNECQVTIICFSLDEPESLHNVVSDWAAEVRHLCKGRPYLLVGTKKDLRDKAKRKSKDTQKKFVTEKIGKQTAKTIGAEAYFECSALEEKNKGKVAKRIFARAIAEAHKSLGL